jgi:hypothetical protein
MSADFIKFPLRRVNPHEHDFVLVYSVEVNDDNGSVEIVVYDENGDLVLIEISNAELGRRVAAIRAARTGGAA